MYLAILYSWIHWRCFILIQLKRTTSGDISGLEYGQLGVEIPGSGAYGQLYVGTSLGASVPIIHEPYFPEGIMLNNDNTYIKWDHSEMLGYSLDLSSDNLIDLHGKTVRIYSGSNGDEMTGYFGSYVQLRDEDNTSSISLNQGVRLGSSNQPIQLFALQGDISMQANEVSLTSIDGPINLQSSNNSQITMTTPQLLLTTVAALPADDAITIQSPYNVLVSVAAFRCDTYPVDDSDVVNKKYVDDLSYYPDDASINTGTMVIMGFVRQLNEVLFSIPLNKQLSGTSFYDCQFKSGNMEVMQGDANTDTSPTYIFGGRQGGQPVVGNVKVDNVYRGNNVLTIRMVREDGSNFTNAHTGPCCIMLRNVTIAGTSQS